MKKLTLFLTLSLLTLIGASTVVTAEQPAKQPIDADPNAVILNEDPEVGSLEGEATSAETEVMDEAAVEPSVENPTDTAAVEPSVENPTDTAAEAQDQAQDAE